MGKGIGAYWVHCYQKYFHETCAYTSISTCAYMRGNRVGTEEYVGGSQMFGASSIVIAC